MSVASFEAHAYDDATVVVEAEGEIDSVSSPELQRLLFASLERADSLVLDLSNVTFMASTGIGAMMSAYAEANTKRAGFAVVVRGSAAERLRLMRLDTLLEVHPTRDAALASLRGR